MYGAKCKFTTPEEEEFCSRFSDYYQSFFSMYQIMTAESWYVLITYYNIILLGEIDSLDPLRREYHTLVLDGPLFLKGLQIDEYSKEAKDSLMYINIQKVSLKNKPGGYDQSRRLGLWPSLSYAPPRTPAA